MSTDRAEPIVVDGLERKLGTIVPTTFPLSLPSGADVPRFKPYTRVDVEEYVRRRPEPRRKTFGPKWLQDQRGAGSCNACATARLLRQVLFARGRFDTPVLDWEFGYAQINGGRDQGSQLADGMSAAQDVGYPVLKPGRVIGAGKIFRGQFSPEDYTDAKNNRAETCFAVDTELELAATVIQFGGAVVAVHVGRNWMGLDASGVVGSDPGPGNHAVLVDDVEIKDGRLLFDHAGSWGPTLHDEGRGYLTWDRHFRVTVGYHRFWAMAGANDGDDPLKV